MSADERLNLNIDEDEKQIDELFLKLQMFGYYEEKYTKIKELFSNLQNEYYGKKLALATDGAINLLGNSASISARYAVDIETDVLEPLKELTILSTCKHYIESIKTNNSVVIDDVVELLEQYKKIPEKLNSEREELFNEIAKALYDLIKKDAELNDKYRIIDILYGYQKKELNIITKVNRLFLEEVNEIFKKNKSPEVIQLVKHATNDVFNKDDIVNLMIATGKKVKEDVKEEQKDTKEFNETKAYMIYKYTNRKSPGDIYNLKAFKKRLKINPLPKNREENLKLREYDLTWIDYTTTREGITVICYADFRNVDLSYTNAIVNPKQNEVIVSLKGANLEGVDMRGVDLRDVDITGANLEKTGADITGSRGVCLGISAYEDNERIKISHEKITPYQFEKMTNQNAFPGNYAKGKFDNYFPAPNRILRQYDLSCVDYSFEYLQQQYKERADRYINWPVNTWHEFHISGFDFSYTNIDINPQEFTEALILNLEGVDLRDKDFTGKEQFFANCNLKGTGAHISPKINPTVSEYIVADRFKSK